MVSNVKPPLKTNLFASSGSPWKHINPLSNFFEITQNWKLFWESVQRRVCWCVMRVNIQTKDTVALSDRTFRQLQVRACYHDSLFRNPLRQESAVMLSHFRCHLYSLPKTCFFLIKTHDRWWYKKIWYWWKWKLSFHELLMKYLQ